MLVMPTDTIHLIYTTDLNISDWRKIVIVEECSRKIFFPIKSYAVFADAIVEFSGLIFNEGKPYIEVEWLIEYYKRRNMPDDVKYLMDVKKFTRDKIKTMLKDCPPLNLSI